MVGAAGGTGRPARPALTWPTSCPSWTATAASSSTPARSWPGSSPSAGRVPTSRCSRPGSTTPSGAPQSGSRLEIARTRGIDAVVLTGGVFQNTYLTEVVECGLAAEGLRVLVHARVPPNDGGLSIGQAAIAALGT